eukprot:m.76667 g.76667  ORF g.76667 m.76667 type:complete len:607 (+) comp24921_c0_seq2:190-2010(+)
MGMLPSMCVLLLVCGNVHNIMALHMLAPLDVCGGACSNSMVLDRNNARLWGLDAAAGAVTIEIDGKQKLTCQSVDGDWGISLGKQEPGVNHTITIASSDGRVANLSDVAFGDVILCSGQSNMEFGLSGVLNMTEVWREAAEFGEGLRVMKIDHFTTQTPQVSLTWNRNWAGQGQCNDRCGMQWARSQTYVPKQGFSTFSAVCFLTGLGVYKGLDQKVPIGMVEAAWGGTRIESWMSPAALDKCPGLRTAKCGPCCTDFKWCNVTEPSNAPACARMNSTNSGNLCSGNYNGMLVPIAQMRFKSMLWYQGESNTDGFQGTYAGPTNYACRLRTAVQDWRALFKDENLPFFNVELASCNTYPDVPDNAIVWAPIRQASRSFLSLPGITGFTTAIDLGYKNGPVHSPEKLPDGWRMAAQLLQKVYNQSVVADGPTIAGPVMVNTNPITVLLSFQNADGLHVATTSGYVGECNGGPSATLASPFEFVYADGNITRATFTIISTTIALTTTPATGVPIEVRYAWEGFPACALYSGVGDYSAPTAHAAAPFRVSTNSAGCNTLPYTRCALGPVAIGADTNASQCCNAQESCVAFGGCQAKLPSKTSVALRTPI